MDSEGLNLYTEVDSLQNLPNPMLIECFYYLHEYGFQNHHDNEISIVEVGSFQ